MRKVLCRLVRLARSSPSCRIPHQGRSPRAPSTHEGGRKPQTATGTIARAASEFQQAHRGNPNTAAALRFFVAEHGEKAPGEITGNDVRQTVAVWIEFSKHTRSNYTKALRGFLRWLEQTQGGQKGISETVPRCHQPAPRGIVATDDERDRILAAATPRMRFFLLLCCDLGIRHRTATRIAIANYDRATRSLRFTTKGNVHQTLPVTGEIAAVIEGLAIGGANRETPIVTLLRPPKQEGHPPGSNPRFIKTFDKLKRQLGIRPELHIHDLRRTCAEDVWEATKDIRLVQAQLGHRSPITTVRYLANKVQLQDLQPVLAKVEAMRRQRRRTP
jgi:integrase